jgi:radical SAM protein with 4Fe4S-binding SPASM domain
MCALTNEDDDYVKGNLEKEVFDNLHGSLDKISILTLNGHGESLMHPGFLKLLSERGKSAHRLELTSNGLMITDEVARTLVSAGLAELTISIHAADPDLYAEITQSNKLDALINNIDTINKYKELYNSAVPALTFQFVSMKRNSDQLEKLLALAHRLRVGKLVILKLLEYGLVQGESLDRHPELVKKHFPSAIKYAQELGIDLVMPPDYIRMLASEVMKETCPENSPGINNSSKTTCKARNCLDPWMTSFITIDGKVYPCCNIRESVGSLKDESFESIWFGDKLTRLQKNILSGNPPQECLTCTQRGYTTLSSLKLKVTMRRLARQPVLKQMYSWFTSHRLFRLDRK